MSPPSSCTAGLIRVSNNSLIMATISESSCNSNHNTFISIGYMKKLGIVKFLQSKINNTNLLTKRLNRKLNISNSIFCFIALAGSVHQNYPGK